MRIERTNDGSDPVVGDMLDLVDGAMNEATMAGMSAVDFTVFREGSGNVVVRHDKSGRRFELQLWEIR